MLREVATPPTGLSRRTLVAIPCYNEELAIAGIVLRARKHASAVLVIDDGSKDRTVETARLAGAIVLENPGNKGKGYGVRRAFRYAREHDYDTLVLMDGDGQHDPDEIPLLLEPVAGRNGRSVDIALGFRFGQNTEMPAWRRVGKRVLDYATAAGGAKVVTDSQCGYRAFGKRAIAEMATKLRDDGFGVESEQLVLAHDAGLSTENVNITCDYDGIDGSTKGPVAHAMGVLAGMVEMIAAKRPLLFVGLPSLCLLVASVGLGIHTLQSYNASRVFSIPWALGTATLAIIGTFGMLSALLLNLVTSLERRILTPAP
ncbi:MAG: glycosyltransferase family 2 protein [Thermoplasmatota archaeon]